MSLDKALLIAIRREYAAAHNGKEPRMLAIYWQFAAEFIANEFLENDDDAFHDWAAGLVDKHITAILAECPELADDESSYAYQEE